jgi:hypothetical protein
VFEQIKHEGGSERGMAMIVALDLGRCKRRRNFCRSREIREFQPARQRRLLCQERGAACFTGAGERAPVREKWTGWQFLAMTEVRGHRLLTGFIGESRREEGETGGKKCGKKKFAAEGFLFRDEITRGGGRG